MAIKLLKTTEEVNNFIKTVRLDHIEVIYQRRFLIDRHRYLVHYTPYKTPEEAVKDKVEKDIKEIEVELAEAEVHMEKLLAMQESSKEPEKIQSGIDNTQTNITNYKAQLKVLYGKEKSFTGE